MRPDDTPALRELAARQCWVISRVQALEHLTARMVHHRLMSGRWQTAHPGVYVTHSGPIGQPERRWIAALGAITGHTALLGGLSALETVGFRGFPSETVHVLVPAGLTPKRPPAGVIVHRTTRLHRSDLHLMGAPPGTMPARSLLDAAQWQRSERRAATIVLAGFQQRLVGPDEMSAAVAAMPRLRHRAVIRETISDAAAGAHSLPEADFLRLCRNAGLPEPQMQQPRHDSSGRQNYLDAYFPDHGLHVEIDGSYHVGVRQWWADMRRQNEVWIPGERVLRFPAWAVRHDPAEVTRQLKAALAPTLPPPRRKS